MQQKSKPFPKEKKEEQVIRWFFRAGNRRNQRAALARKWLREGQYSKYRYIVDRCNDGSQIYLKRPTWLNKGFDFQVNVEGFRSNTRKRRGGTLEMPSHPDVVSDLRKKRKKFPRLAEDLFQSICDVYDCMEIPQVLRRYPRLKRIRAGLDVDKTLRIIKWLFIEQDLTYWLGRGRNMFMAAIESKVFKIKVREHV